MDAFREYVFMLHGCLFVVYLFVCIILYTSNSVHPSPDLLAELFHLQCSYIVAYSSTV